MRWNDENCFTASFVLLKNFVEMSVIIMVNLKRKYYELNNVVKCDIFVLSKRERR